MQKSNIAVNCHWLGKASFKEERCIGMSLFGNGRWRQQDKSSSVRINGGENVLCRALKLMQVSEDKALKTFLLLWLTGVKVASRTHWVFMLIVTWKQPWISEREPVKEVIAKLFVVAVLAHFLLRDLINLPRKPDFSMRLVEMSCWIFRLQCYCAGYTRQVYKASILIFLCIFLLSIL